MIVAKITLYSSCQKIRTRRNIREKQQKNNNTFLNPRPEREEGGIDPSTYLSDAERAFTHRLHKRRRVLREQAKIDTSLAQQKDRISIPGSYSLPESRVDL